MKTNHFHTFNLLFQNHTSRRIRPSGSTGESALKSTGGGTTSSSNTGSTSSTYGIGSGAFPAGALAFFFGSGAGTAATGTTGVGVVGLTGSGSTSFFSSNSIS